MRRACCGWRARGLRGFGATAETLTRCGVEFEQLDRAALEKRYPQINFDGIATGIFEPTSGVLMARRAVAAVVEDAIFNGVEYRVGEVLTPAIEAGRRGCRRCGRAAAKSLRRTLLFLLAGRGWGRFFRTCWASGFFRRGRRFIFLACRRAMRDFRRRRLPAFLFQGDEYYGMPDIEARGFKIALDKHGARVDPDTQSRIVTEAAAHEVRAYVERRFPALRGAPIVETRVCQYENTSSGDFLIDRHPDGRECLVCRRRVGARIQTWAGGGGVCRGAGAGWGGGGAAVFVGDEGKSAASCSSLMRVLRAVGLEC